ncbi:hypothetical protein AHF37_00402 [Paragonimus kellicotti]|nr:hypothetical protein AHF37_00402 [Paragonimus kellicotti]
MIPMLFIHHNFLLYITFVSAVKAPKIFTEIYFLYKLSDFPNRYFRSVSVVGKLGTVTQEDCCGFSTIAFLACTSQCQNRQGQFC